MTEGSLRTAAGEDAPVDHHRDAVGEREHRGHVVLHQDHGETALEPRQQRHQPVGFLAAGAGHRLVEQDQLRRHGERDGEFERALLAVGQRAGWHMDAFAEPDFFERRAGGAVERRLRRGAAEEPEARSAARLDRERDVFQRREARQDRGDLERSREAQSGACVHRQRGDVAAVEPDAAALRFEETGYLIDERGLAGAIGADHGVQFPRRHLQRHAVGDGERAELLAQILDAQDRVSHAASSTVSAQRRRGRRGRTPRRRPATAR
jgi:hypothetical protein